MKMSELSSLLLVAGLSAITLAGQTMAVIRSRPLPSPQEAANLESHVLENPDDVDARIELLQLYLDTAPPPPSDDPGRRGVRLQHVLYLVEHHPEAAASASNVAYVYRANGPYANAADHDAVRHQWLAAVQGHPGNNAVTLNAVKFLSAEDPEDAEQVLRRALADDPENREIAANLGFRYALEILGNAPGLAAHASTELQQTSNAVVLAAAGTALPNLAVRASAGRPVDEKIFDLASELSARARQLAPTDQDIQGPMPLIKYFAAAQNPNGRR
jgi:tetratricopeptide (TPR) repeat protein